MSAYVLAVFGSTTALRNSNLPEAVRVASALMPTIPILVVRIAIMRALRESDELIQRIQLQAAVFAAITTGLMTFSYGFLENIGFPSFPTIWILPMMFVLWGVGLGYFTRRSQ